MQTSLANKTVVVTGASGGIGSAIARKFAQEGAHLVLHYRSNRESARALQEQLGRENSLLVQADLTREREVQRLFARARKRFGRVDTLIANAGSWENEDTPLQRISLQRWRRIQDAVLTSTFLCFREFFKLLARQRRGNGLLIASTAGIFGEAGHADYAAAKAAVAFGLTRTLKNEIARLAPHTADYCGGRINCICPGWTVVARTAKALRDPAMVRKVTATMALKQIARPDDIAHSAVFLSCDVLARHITGQTLVLAGGMEGRLLWAPHEIEPKFA